MSNQKSRKKQAKLLRNTRKIHRLTGIFLFIFFIIIAITGGLLGWKKHSAGIILPATTKGTSSDLIKWMPLHQLHEKANSILRDSISPSLSNELDRIDVRNEKGIVKFVYKNHLNGIQLDGVTGELLQIGKRRSDFIETIHDGSIVDEYLGIPNGIFKLFYTTLMGLALFMFSITGFWLWYGPKRLKNSAKS